MIEWKIERRKIKDLKDHPKNPRRMTKAQETQLSQSLEKFGLIDKPIINIDNTLIGGHQRTRVLKKLGYKEIDCYVPSRQLTDKELDELCIRLNKTGGEFDYDILANEWELDLLVDLGFTEKDFGFELDIEKDEIAPKMKKNKQCPHCGGDI